MNNIDIFNNSEIILRRKSLKIKYYIISMFILITILINFLIFYQYNPYLNLKAILVIENDNYYLKTLIDESQINDINKNTLIISNKKYKYKVKNISEDYILDENYNKYYEVLLNAKIDKKLIINNNIIDISIKQPKTTFAKELIKKIKKGMK